jgi:hypothetical protein
VAKTVFVSIREGSRVLSEYMIGLPPSAGGGNDVVVIGTLEGKSFKLVIRREEDRFILNWASPLLLPAGRTLVFKPGF